MHLQSGLETRLTEIFTQGGAPEKQFAALREPFEACLRSPPYEIAQYATRSPNPYARYLVSDARAPIELVLAFWGPGSESPIHDHAGVTGAVGLISGMAEEVKCVLEPAQSHFRLVSQTGGAMIPGAAIPIMPGVTQIHRMANHGTEWAVTLHAYLGRLSHINRFLPVAADLYRAEPRELWFD